MRRSTNAQRRRALQRDRGFGAVGLLAALLVLGGVAAIVLTQLPSSATNPLAGLGTSLPAPVAQPLQGEASAAARQACEASYSTAEQAVSAYEVQHGSPPTDVSQLQGYLRGALSTSLYTISIDPHRPGQIQIQTPGHPAADGDSNCAFA